MNNDSAKSDDIKMIFKLNFSGLPADIFLANQPYHSLVSLLFHWFCHKKPICKEAKQHFIWQKHHECGR